MMLGAPWDHALAGRIETALVESVALAANPLGDPTRRPVLVQLPPGYDDEPERRYRSIYILQGYGGMLTDWGRRGLLQPTTPELVDNAFVTGAAPPSVVVWVDAWTRLGGSQFLDSAGTGRYQSYLCEDVVAFVDTTYRTVAHRNARAVLGLSSGGYGAAMAAMARPDVFGAFGSHAGDGAFEVSLVGDIARAYALLRDRYDRDPDAFARFLAAPGAALAGDEFPLLMTYCLAACYSPGPDGRPELPVDPASGAWRAEIWDRWLALDPVRVAPAHLDALSSMRAAWIDAGCEDEYHLDLAAERLAAVVRAAGTPVHHELFSGTHRHLSRRYPLSLAYLAAALTTD